MRYMDTGIEWLGHAGFLIEGDGVLLYFDPFEVSDSYADRKADIVLITHNHHDHFSTEDLKKIAAEKTDFVCPAGCGADLSRLAETAGIREAAPGEEFSVRGVRVKTFPAYNLNKQFHPKNKRWCGYMINVKGVKIYHAGDTDFIPEMKELAGERINIALLPVGGTYTMDVEEAAGCAAAINPEIAVPMHYGSIIGSGEDAARFKKLCGRKNIDVKIKT